MNIYIKFYDFMAVIIRFLEDHTDGIFYIRYRGATSSFAAQMCQSLEKKFPELIQKETGHPLEIIDDDRWNDDFFARFARFIDQCIEGTEFSGKLTDSIGSISIEEENRCDKKTCKENCLFVCEVPLPK